MRSPTDQTVVIGIDPAASRLASLTAREGRIGATQPDLCDHSKVSFGTPWHTTHTGLAMQWMWDVIGVARAYGVPVVYLEEPLVGRGGVKSTMVQAFTSGAVQAACAIEGVPVHLVNVGTWKKEVLGNGRADKSDVMELVRHRWPDGADAGGGDQDLADAAAITIYGLAQLRLQHRMAGTVGVHRADPPVLQPAHMLGDVPGEVHRGPTGDGPVPAGTASEDAVQRGPRR